MSNITPFRFDEAHVRALELDGEVWFVGRDIADVLGYRDHNAAMRDHCKGVRKSHPLPTSGGTQEVRLISEPDMLRLVVNSTLPSAERFERWVFEEVLPSIRKTGTYTAKSAITPLKATAEAAKAFAPLVRVARLLGCDKNAAAISANQAIYSMTNINLMQQLGHTHLEAEKQDSHWYTATELGKQMTPAVSARQVNLLLAEAGLQFKRGDVWEATEAGKDFARIYDTGKRHGSGVAVTQMKWSATVLAVLQALPLESKEAA